MTGRSLRSAWFGDIWFSPNIPDKVKDETKDKNYNSFKYSFIGTLLNKSPETSVRPNIPDASPDPNEKVDVKPSVTKMMKEVFCKSMLSWSYLAFIIFYSGSV